MSLSNQDRTEAAPSALGAPRRRGADPEARRARLCEPVAAVSDPGERQARFRHPAAVVVAGRPEILDRAHTPAPPLAGAGDER
ncbi:hypothetical protein ACWG5P_31575 [Streptomyces prasinus]